VLSRHLGLGLSLLLYKESPNMEPAYNKRLFSSGLRKRWHLACFFWLREQLSRDFGLSLQGRSVIELGCFDAKTLDYLPAKPRHYMGYDAGWGGGLDHAQQRFFADPAVNLALCQSPEEIVGNYDLAICLETLEHLPLDQLESFVTKLAASAPRLYASVPVELGPVFLMKHAYKVATLNRPDAYTLRELAAATVGMTSAVGRIEGVHKGFDYRDLIKLILKNYTSVQTFNLHLPGLPLWMSGGVGLVASNR
jgi:hypothetical protein